MNHLRAMKKKTCDVMVTEYRGQPRIDIVVTEEISETQRSSPWPEWQGCFSLKKCEGKGFTAKSLMCSRSRKKAYSVGGVRKGKHCAS